MIDQTFTHISDSQPKLSLKELARPPPLYPTSTGIAGLGGRLKSGKQHVKGLSQAIVFMPVADPTDEFLSEDRAATINHVDVEAMNSDLAARLATSSSSSSSTNSNNTPPPLKIPFVFNDLLVHSETTDGLHYSEKMIKKQAEILLGWRCNNVSGKMTGSCCKSYKVMTPVQGLVLLVLVGWAPLAMFLRKRGSEYDLLCVSDFCGTRLFPRMI